MDAVDEKLIRLLSENADTTATELATHIDLSIAAISKRIAKMKDAGVIRRTCILTDPAKIGKPIIAYILFALKSGEDRARLAEKLPQLGDALECYSVTGEYDCMMKVCAASVEAFNEKLQRFREDFNVVRMQTMFTLREWKYDPVAMPDEGFFSK